MATGLIVKLHSGSSVQCAVVSPETVPSSTEMGRCTLLFHKSILFTALFSGVCSLVHREALLELRRKLKVGSAFLSPPLNDLSESIISAHMSSAF